MSGDPTVQTVFWSVVLARFVLPLFIPRWPLPAIVACLVLDAVDQKILLLFGYDPPFYQDYDKAMDMFYLAVAYISMLRNWSSRPAFEIARFLFYLRLIGVVAFQLTAWRPLLLIFPNTFELFFIAYEICRLRWNPARFGIRFWIAIAALIWVIIKIPMEYWIHVAKLDFTDTFIGVAWFRWTFVGLCLALLAVLRYALLPRLAPPEHSWRIVADSPPRKINDTRRRFAHIARHGRILSLATLEKVFLIGLVGVIFGGLLPGVHATTFQLFFGIGLFVVLNAALGLWSIRIRRRGIESYLLNFAAVFAVNIGLVYLFGLLLGRVQGAMDRPSALFFVFLFSVMITMYDRYHPVHDFRFGKRKAAPHGTSTGA